MNTMPTPPNRPRPTARRLATIALGLMTCGVFAPSATAQNAPKGPPPATVRVGEVRLEPVQQHRLIVGSIEASKRTLVAAEERGRVVTAPPEEGDAVKAGQILARVDTALLKIERDAARADIQQTEAQIAERQAEHQTARRTRIRIEELHKSEVAVQTEFDDAVDAEAAALARLEFVKAFKRSREIQLEQIETRLAMAQSPSPFDGYVVMRHTELGQWLNPGDPIAEIVVTSSVKVVLDVPQAMIDHLPMDQPIDIQIDALDLTRQQTIYAIVPDANRQSRTFGVHIQLDNPDGKLKPGMSVAAELPTGATINATTVPRDAVQTTPTGSVVYANRGGVAVSVPVSIRFGSGDRFVVDGQLRPNEPVVIEGNERLTPGTPLKVINPNGPDS
ncbi:MAG: efflux RND transporter periplasmic adaptor subunit [Planctomycetota bacterium]